MPPVGSAKLNNINRGTIQAAGPRYTPGVDALAPNLRIQSLLDAMDALALSDGYRDSLKVLTDSLQQSWRDASSSLTRAFAGKTHVPDVLAKLLAQLSSEKAGTSGRTLRRIKTTANAISKTLTKRQEKLWERQSKVERGSDEARAIDHELYRLRNLSSAVSDVVSFTRSPGFTLVEKNRMFIRGDWGTGKTHFLCDVTKKRMNTGLPTLMVLAHRLPTDSRPLEAICRATGIAASGSALLAVLDSLGKKARARALIIVDGINEADRASWRKGLPSIARLVSHYPNVGLIVSCRSPFERQIVSSYAARLFTETVHTGFEEIEFDAQREFFAYYAIPNPHVPLLVPEFTRPLFLKMLCLSLSGKTVTTKSRNIQAIASGQKGMTKVFEDFIGRLGREIEQDFQLPSKTCWRLMKGDTVTRGGPKVGLAVTMADTVRDYVTPDECATIIQAWTGWTDPPKIRQLMRRLMTDGLLSEDIRWKDGQSVDIVRLPYQRFSDHLICRHLLETHLRGENEHEIRRAFYGNRPLGKIFALDKWKQTYRMAGLASAIMLEFPERVKRILPEEDRELVFYLPKKVRYVAPLVNVFLEGLLWRPQSSFSKHTGHIISTLLKQNNDVVQHEILEVLVCLATRQGHPYSGRRLVQYLGGLLLVERDLFWTEFMRRADETSVLYRLLDWIEETSAEPLAELTAQNLVRLCALYLTSTNRPLRDRATKALVLLGERSPRALFQVTREMLGFNDPYVPERMLAASYGVLMRQWAFAKPSLREAASDFACAMFDEMFKARAPHATTHIPARDYALGFISLARNIKPTCLGRRPARRITPPLPRIASRIPSASRIRDRDCEGTRGAIHMDFENYTIGRLVESRSPYDFKHREYRSVLRQIKWRVLDLGYTEEKFDQIDKWIAESTYYRSRNDESEKTDRYGKKYSWIAFFEVAGMRADRGVLPHYEEGHRSLECDIDPSFPGPARVWRPPFKAFFGRAVRDPVRWIRSGGAPVYRHLLHVNEMDGIEGPWVLLNGFVQEKAPRDIREVFTFMRGLLADKRDIARLRSKFQSIEYPGNDAVPEVGSNQYVFAGEIPWSPKFGTYLRSKNGRACRDVREAFESTRRRTVRKRFSALTNEEMREFVMQQRQASWMQNFIRSLNDESGVPEQSDVTVPKFVEFTRYEKVPGVTVEIPANSYGGGGFQSKENKARSREYPAPALCETLRLRKIGSNADLVDGDGRPASLYREFDSGSALGRSHLLFLRKDLLKVYLNRTGQRIVWLLWGERSVNYEHLERMRSRLQDTWGKHNHIHRKMIVGRD